MVPDAPIYGYLRCRIHRPANSLTNLRQVLNSGLPFPYLKNFITQSNKAACGLIRRRLHNYV